MFELHDRVSFVKNLVTIIGKIVDYFYDDDGEVGVIVKDFNGGLHAVKESELMVAR